MQPRPKVTICGSFKKDTAVLADLFLELEATNCRVLSPLSLHFADPTADFVALPSESDLSIKEIEKFHLRAIAESDFIWLHDPDGYVGISGSFELGYAYAKGKPIFSNDLPNDVTLQQFVSVVPSVFTALKTIQI